MHKEDMWSVEDWYTFWRGCLLSVREQKQGFRDHSKAVYPVRAVRMKFLFVHLLDELVHTARL